MGFDADLFPADRADFRRKLDLQEKDLRLI